MKFDTVFRIDKSRESYEEQVDEQIHVSSRKFESRSTNDLRNLRCPNRRRRSTYGRVSYLERAAPNVYHWLKLNCKRHRCLRYCCVNFNFANIPNSHDKRHLKGGSTLVSLRVATTYTKMDKEYDGNLRNDGTFKLEYQVVDSFRS